MHLSSKSLVLVVGAGASKEAGLPMGSELKTKIASALDIRYENGYHKTSGDQLIDEAFRLLVRKREESDINPHLRISRMISGAMPQAASIDNYIDAHRDNFLIAECGKLGIARCILEAEASSLMRVDNRNIYNKINFKELETTWYNAFFQTLVQGCQVTNMAKRLSNVAIITFNYDRCIENYLHSSLRNYYGIEIVEATELMRHLTIYHPYGHLGSLVWAESDRSLDFGAEANASQLIDIANLIKTFTEGTDESHSQIAEIRSTLKTASRVAYLGFAFNPQNLTLLYGAGDTPTPTATSVVGTAYGLSESDIDLIESDLVQLGGLARENLRIRRDLTCSQLFQEFGRSLTIR